MRGLFFLFVMLFCQHLANAQVEFLKVDKSPIDVPNANFVLAKVVDARLDSMYLGTINVGSFNKVRVVKFKGGNQKMLNSVVGRAGLLKPQQPGAFYLRVDALKIFEYDFEFEEIGVCEMRVTFFVDEAMQTAPVHVAQTTIADTNSDVFYSHGYRINRALQTILRDFNAANATIKLPDNGQDDYVIPVQTANEQQQNRQSAAAIAYKEDSAYAWEQSLPGARNVLAIGYQIGGFTVIGMEYEFRLADYVGINVGFGLLGYSGGIKLHISPSKNSLFLYPNFKDGGFGEIGSFCMEMGGRLRLNKRRPNGIAIHVQGGVQRVLYASEQFSLNMYNQTGSAINAGDVLLVLGLGISF